MLKIIQLVEGKLELFITTLRKYHFERNKVCVCVCVCVWNTCWGGGGNKAMTNGFELVGPNGRNKEENLNQSK